MELETRVEKWSNAFGYPDAVCGTSLVACLNADAVTEPVYDLSALGAGLSDEHEQNAFKAVLGTCAPTHWIAPSTYEVGLSAFPPLRKDPVFVDPDPVVVVMLAGPKTRLVQVTQRVLPEIYDTDLRPARWKRRSDAQTVSAGDTTEVIRSEHATQPCMVAREVRDLSGLSARQLGDLFPVARENFQRWISGDTTPSDTHLQRLLFIRHFLRALNDRVDEPKTWLFAPLDSAGHTDAYTVLKSGNVNSLWEAIAHLPNRAPRERWVAGDGEVGVRISTSLRGAATSTPEEELDEYAEWLDEE